MNALQLSIGNACRVSLRMSDFNRLRWTYYALQTNAVLRRSLQDNQSQHLVDSTSLFPDPVDLPPHASIVLWDGYNSYLELLRKRPELAQRLDLQFACIGSFAEVAAALPARSQKLFPDSAMLAAQDVGAPLAFKAALRLKTTLRAFKNLARAPARHRQLSEGGNLVFCGLLRPNRHVVANILTSKKLLALEKSFEELGKFPWASSPEDIRKHVCAVYRQCQQLETPSAEDYCGIYAVLNLCARVYVVHALVTRGSRVFINEYGFQGNFDPYDVHAYSNNTFLDFGSSRGACHWYPRTMDMHATGKRFVPFRMIGEHQSLGDFLGSHGANHYADQLDAFVQQVKTATVHGAITP